jgi:hypothetical protein
MYGADTDALTVVALGALRFELLDDEQNQL